MQKSKYIYCLFFLLLSWLASGCEDYLDINTDPNNPTVAPISGLLANTSFQTGFNMYEIGDVTSYYVQYLASPNPGSATDTQEPVSYDDAWKNVYNILTDLSDLEVKAQEEGATDYLGVAKILKAVHVGLMVDVWGNIPYSEAFFAQTLNPAYDNAQQLYDTLQLLLDNGIAELQKGTSTATIEGDDFIYEGNIETWMKAAHALKARYLLHMSETDQYDPQAILAEVDQGFASTADDMQVPYFEERINPWAQAALNNASLILDGWISQQLVQSMDGTTYGYVDPRMPYMFGTTEEGEFVGTENGAGRGDAPEQGARSTLVTDSYYAARTAPILVITYFEQKFIEAEAALAAGDANRAYAAYQEGIRAHMGKIGVDTAAIDAYLANPAVSVGAAGLSLDLILKEKYIAMFLSPEAWIDARRYDYQYEGMSIPANLNPDLNGQFIRRLIYPTSETTRNSANVPAVTLSDRLWWDQ